MYVQHLTYRKCSFFPCPFFSFCLSRIHHPSGMLFFFTAYQLQTYLTVFPKDSLGIPVLGRLFPCLVSFKMMLSPEHQEKKNGRFCVWTLITLNDNPVSQLVFEGKDLINFYPCKLQLSCRFSCK